MSKKSKELFFEILENIDCTLTVGNHDNLLLYLRCSMGSDFINSLSNAFDNRQDSIARDASVVSKTHFNFLIFSSISKNYSINSY